MDAVQLAATLAGIVLLASVLSVELGVTVALLELTLGVAAGNIFNFTENAYSRAKAALKRAGMNVR